MLAARHEQGCIISDQRACCDCKSPERGGRVLRAKPRTDLVVRLSGLETESAIAAI